MFTKNQKQNNSWTELKKIIQKFESSNFLKELFSKYKNFEMFDIINIFKIKFNL